MKNLINKLSVRGKILLIIGINLFFLLIIGVISYNGLNTLNNIKEEITTNSSALQYQQSADMMHDALRGDCFNAMLTEKTDWEGKNVVRADIKDHSQNFRDQLKELNKLKLPSNVMSAIQKVGAPLENYIVTSNQMVVAALDKNYNRNSPFFVKLSGEFETAFTELEGKMEKLSDLIGKQSHLKMEEGNRYAANIKLFLLILIASVILIAVLISLYISNRISNPINETKLVLDRLSVGEDVETIQVENKDEIGAMVESINSVVTNMNAVKEYVSEVGSGNFDTDITIFNNQGAIYSSLNMMRESLKQTTEDEKKRNWATEGLAKFGDILRGNNDGLEALADNIISGLVKYLNANQGGLFVVNDNNTSDVHLELLACYAWNKKKYLHMRVDQGEGLVGQAWQEADTLYITDVPENFVKISSGLGDANPKSFLIVPLTVNDVTFGVIEIASFTYFEQYHIDFVNKLAESIASTLSTAKTNERTKVLLEQSQQQTEEMRAQEEEMRQNMEEMQATQEEMERKELEMTSMVERMQQQEEEMRQNMEEMQATQEEMERIQQENQAQNRILDSVAIISKTDLKGNITYVNDEFLKWSKYTKEEVMGKNHRMLKSGDQDDQIFVDMWKTISSGNIFRGEIKNKAKDGSFYWVDAIIAPVLDDSGKPKEYLAQRFVINEQKEKEQETGAQKAILDQICIISKTDLQGNITYVNDEFLKWSKYTKEEVMGKNHRMLKSGDQDDQIFVDMWKTISSGKIFRGEIKNKAKDGSFYWVDAIIAPVLDDKGKPVEYMAQRFVINEQKEKEQETGAQKAILDQICIISKTDLQGNITYVNDEFLKWSKYTKEEVMGKNHRMLKSGDQDDQIFVDMWKTISSGKIFRGEIKNKAKDGSFYWVDAIVAPVLDDKGKPVEYMAQRFVINEQKEKEEKLSELFKKLNNKD
jgi:methyl-accepting chemotaxis protein